MSQVNSSNTVSTKLYNDQRNAQVFNLFIYEHLLLPYMFRAFIKPIFRGRCTNSAVVQVPWVWCQRPALLSYPSTPGSPHWSLSLRFPHQNPVHASPLPHTRDMTHQSHSSRFYHPHNSGWGVQIIKHLIMKFLRSLNCSVLIVIASFFASVCHNFDVTYLVLVV
jgi:hypothetical protein